jgi:uncharacterized protein HemX
MMWLRFAPWAAAALAIGAALFLWWQNQGLNEEVGTLKRDKASLEQALKVKEDARKNRATTDGAVRRMAPVDKLERLR